MNDISSMDDAMKERLHMLKNREKEGTLTDRDLSELQQLKKRIARQEDNKN